jgi:hypothetical protein
VGLCVTDRLRRGTVLLRRLLRHARSASAASENIAIQNNRFRGKGNEGILFYYDAATAIDTIRILKNDLPQQRR